MNSKRSKQPIKQSVKNGRGAKCGPNITKVIRHRKEVETTFLKLYIGGCLDIKATAGFTTLARYLYSLKMFYNKSDKPISVNTIRQELTEIAKEEKIKNPRSNKNKK